VRAWANVVETYYVDEVSLLHYRSLFQLYLVYSTCLASFLYREHLLRVKFLGIGSTSVEKLRFVDYLVLREDSE
jgi:hypothetical protein